MVFKGRGSFNKLGTASEIHVEKQSPQKISGTFTEVWYLKMKLQNTLQVRVLLL